MKIWCVEWKVVWHWKWNRMFRLVNFWHKKLDYDHNMHLGCASIWKSWKKKHPDTNTNGENDQHKTHIVFCPGAVVIIFVVRGSRPVPLVVSRAEPLQLFPVASSWREKNETDFPKRSLSNLQTQCAACYSQIRWVVWEAVARAYSPLK